MATPKYLGRLVPQNVAFFLCDMQERFRPAICCFSDILEVARRMVEASKTLNIPLVVSEQYPKGLGKTVPELDVGHAALTFDKTKFSMLLPEVEAFLLERDIKQVVLFGIEAHVCVQQTTLDLLNKGIEVHVIADSTSSRSKMDRQFAFERLRQAGAVISTSESTLLQLVGDKDNEHFKAIQGLIMKSAPTSDLVPASETKRPECSN